MNTKLLAASSAMKRRSVLKGAVVLGGALLVPAQVRAQEGQPKMGGILRVTMPYNPAALDPMTGRNLPDFNTLYAVYDALIDFDPNTLDLKPGLAKTFEFTDATTLVMTLEQDIEFHDGTPFDAEAVKFNIERYKTDERSNIKSDLSTVETVEVNGPHKVTFHLNQPNAGLLAILTNRAGCMISPTAIKNSPDGYVDREPVGTGPFKFVEWRDNEVIRVEKNTNYWKPGQPYLDGLELNIINEHNTANRSVIAGQADLALNLTATQIAVAKRSEGVIATAEPSLVFYDACFNYGRGPLADVKVRQAANYALDRDALNRVLMGGYGDATCSMFPDGFWANDPETAHYYEHDPDRSRSLLKEAGFDNGVELQAWGWPDQGAMQRQELLATQLAEGGIKLNITPAAPAQGMQYFLLETKGDVWMSPQGGLPDPAQIYERLFAANALRNASKMEPEGFRPLMDATVNTYEREERVKAFSDLQRYVVENAMHLPHFTSSAMATRNEKVKDFVFGILNSPKFHTVWLDSEA